MTESLPTSAMLSMQKEAAAIVKRLSVMQKIALCSGRDMWYLKRVAHLEPVMITDGPHGLRKQSEGDATDLLKGRVLATCFPTACCLACSWDEHLIYQVGVALAHECIQENVAVLLGPGMNIKRHACGGRNFEYLSEDPLLSGRLAASYVQGVQSQGVGTSIKHFCVNNQEHARMRINAIVDERTLREIYWRNFEHTVKISHPCSIMCAYNRVNGVFCSENESLWKMVREEWGFDGVVVTDWGATNDRVRGILAGVDLEMPGSKGAFDNQVRKAVKRGQISKEILDATVTRNVTLSLLGKAVVERTVEVNMEDHHELARKVAMECVVLLKNEGNLLPLVKNTSIAVIGEFAKHPRFQGMGSSQVNASQLDCAWDRIQQYSDKIVYAPGYCEDGDDKNIDLIQEAVNAAKNADTALLFCGLPEIYESEGFDRPHMNMPATHNALVDALCAANPRTVVILSNGAPVAMPWVKKPGAILEGYLAGQGGASAIVDLIFGVASPCGKLAESFPVCLEDIASNAYFRGHHDHMEYREGLNVGYRYFDSADVPVLFPFGHGLSYTKFEYSDLQATLLDEFCAHIKFTLRNVGSVRAAEIVQCYVHDVETTVYRPQQELKAFSKFWLDPGEHQNVEFTLDKDAFTFYDVGHKTWIVEPGNFQIRVGASSRDVRLQARIHISAGQAASQLARKAHPPFPHIPGQVTDEAFLQMLGTESLPMPNNKIRPYHRNSLMAELKHSMMGRLVRRKVHRVAIAEMENADDPAQLRMVKELVDNMPLRGLVIFSQGELHFEDLDTLIAFLNLRFLKTILHIGPVIKRRCRKSKEHHEPLGMILMEAIDA